MSFVGTVQSQINNILFFRPLFPLKSLVKNVVTFPLDYALATGRAFPPMVINILLTSRCNLRCSMCSAYEFRQKRFSEMTVEDLNRLVRSLKKYRPTLYFGGGEPLVRDDILDLIATVKKYDLPLGMVTNGLLLSPERAEKIRQLGLDHILVSLHGPESTHDIVTGTPGAFRRTTENLKFFCRRPRKTSVMMNFVLSKDNIEKIDEMIMLGRTLGVDRVRIEHLLFMTEQEQETHRKWCAENLPFQIKAAAHASTLICQQAAVAGFSDSLPTLLEGIKRRYGSFVFIKPALTRKEIMEWYSEGYQSRRRCLFIWRSLFLDPEGYVIPCQHYAELKLGNALREPLLEIWNSYRYRLFRGIIRQGLLPACSRCCKL